MDTFTIGWVDSKGYYRYIDVAGMDDLTDHMKRVTNEGGRVTRVTNRTWNTE